MGQLSFSSLSRKERPKSRVHRFLSEMDEAIMWKKIVKVIKPYYYTGKMGRKPLPLELMLRIYFLQLGYSLGDPSVEEAIYDRTSFQKFLKIELLHDIIPDETTILNFRHLLEEHRLNEKILRKVNHLLEKKGFLLKEGTIVDATLIAAPSSTKNKEGRRDPEMSSTKKNDQWFFGMKMHIGVDAKSGLIHSCVGTTAKVSDRDPFPELLHEEEQAVFGDKGYVSDNDKHLAREAGIFWGILDKRKPGKKLSQKQKKRNLRLSSIRSKVEHPFQVIKHLWGYRKTRTRGMRKNQSQFFILAALHNVYRMRKSLAYT